MQIDSAAQVASVIFKAMLVDMILAGVIWLVLCRSRNKVMRYAGMFTLGIQATGVFLGLNSLLFMAMGATFPSSVLAYLAFSWPGLVLRGWLIFGLYLYCVASRYRIISILVERPAVSN